MSVAITATVQSFPYPPRVGVAVTGLTVSDELTVYRSVGGVRTAVRSADDVVVDATTFAVVDAEQPFGVPVTYIAYVNGADADSTSPATYTLTGGKVGLSDAISGASAEVVITAWPELRRERLSSSFVVGGRNVVVSGQLAPPTSSLEVMTMTSSSRSTLLSLLAGLTSGIVQVRQPGGYTGVDAYLAVTGVSERRWSQDGTDERRLWTLTVAEVEAWPGTLLASAFTLQDIADVYTSLTLADFADDYATLIDAAFGDYTV